MSQVQPQQAQVVSLERSPAASSAKDGICHDEPPKNELSKEDTHEYPPLTQVLAIMAAILLVMFLVALDRLIIGVAIPRITDQFDSLGDVGWYGSAYLLTACAFMLLMGKVYTFVNPKWVYLSSLAVFEIGSAVCGAAPNSTAFIIGRAIAGLGNAGLFQGAVVIIVYIIPLHKRPQYMGVMGTVFGVASAVGPLLGGAFTDGPSWRWCFYINLPCGAVVSVLLVLFLHIRSHNFTLRHIFHHGTYQYPHLHKRLDVREYDELWTEGDEQSAVAGRRSFQAVSRAEPIQRLSDRSIQTVEDLVNKRQSQETPYVLDALSWTIDAVPGPNITDKDTVISLANIAADAYVKVPGEEDWTDVNQGENRNFNHSAAFGWEGDGLRGHIFADQDNSTIVIGLKGTTPAVFDGSGSTTRDKENDNLFFSCCCGQGGHYLWRRVCDCNTAAYTCNNTCLIKTLREKNMYYTAAMELYGNVTEMYPDSQIWLAGHSLGGSVSSLLGLTFGLPVTTFEAPAEALAAARLGLPVPPGFKNQEHQLRQFTGAYHFGHTADPIFMGTCNAATSACTLGGYAMETQCHTGKVCVYDTVEDKQWRVSASTHSIRSVLKNVIKVYDDLPTCEPDSTEDDPCVDCFNWKYFESNGSEITSTSTRSSTTSTSTSSLTRTETCKTPGWWGCLDESTTTTTSSSSTSSSATKPLTTSTITTTISSCAKYGWFGGCLEPVTSSSTYTTTITPAMMIEAKSVKNIITPAPDL